MELWDLYTIDRKQAGKTHIRGQEIPEGYYHLVVHVWIKNSRGEYLISQRAASRPTFPLQWECVGGSVIAGEDSLSGALREVKEEVGLDLSPDSGSLIFTKTRSIIGGKAYQDIMDVWLFHYDGDVCLSNATTDEVAQAQWMTPAQIQELYDSGKLVGNLAYFFTEIEATEG
ncbi:MAG: NUDIX domain-containing protein [Oscillospiraceae bacterium]|nr:NUDIX domain-containing protein [Oscillospiraceae bacterium]